MTVRREKAEVACRAALQLLEERLLTAPVADVAPDANGYPPADMVQFTRGLLIDLRLQLLRMEQCLNPEQFMPSYGRFLVDSQMPDDPLVEMLSDALYCYGRIRAKDLK